MTLKAEEGSSIEVASPSSDGKYSAGSTLSFQVKVSAADKELNSVEADGHLLEEEDGVYSFVVPNHDFEIKTTLMELGGDVNVTKITDPSSIPNSLDAIKTALENSDKLNEKYLSKAHLESNTVETYSYGGLYDSSAKRESFDFEVGSNDVSHVFGYSSGSLSYGVDESTFEERSFDDGYSYAFVNEGNYYGESTDAQEKLSLKNLKKISDAEDSSFKTSDAKKEVSNFALATKLKNKVIGSSYSSDNIAYTSNSEPVVISAKVADDHLSYTLDLKAANYYKGWSETSTTYATFALSLTFDGDGFLLKSDFDYAKYAYDQFTAVTGTDSKVTVTLKDDAKKKESYVLSLTQERGYRHFMEKEYDIHDYAAEEYDVHATQSLPSSGTAVENNVTYVSADVKFDFTPTDGKTVLIPPVAKSIKEGDEAATISDGVVTPKKVGDYTVVFDNGFGKTKEVKFSAVRPDPQKISLSVDGTSYSNGMNVYLNTAVSLVPSVTPSGAEQGVSFAVASDSAAQATLVENADGSTTLTPTSSGTLKLVATSKALASVTQNFSFSVQEPLSASSIKTYLTGHTLVAKSAWSYWDDFDESYSYYNIQINFASDGTGKFRVGTKTSSWSSTVTYDTTAVNFTYSIDETTCAFTITDTDASTSGSYKLSSFTALTNDSFKASLSSSKNGSQSLDNLQGTDRVDF